MVGGCWKKVAAKTKCMRAKKFCRAPPEGSAQWYCTRQMEAGGRSRRAQQESRRRTTGCTQKRKPRTEQGVFAKSNPDIDKFIPNLILIDTGKKSQHVTS